MVNSDNGTVEEVDEFLSELRKIPKKYISQSCLVDGELPLQAYCHYLFPLCINDTIVKITQERCKSLKENCSTEFTLLPILHPGFSKYEKYVPRCHSECNGNETFTMQENVSECRDHFIKTSPALCLPSCTEAVFGSKRLHEIDNALVSAVSILTIIGGIIFLVLAIIKRKKM